MGRLESDTGTIGSSLDRSVSQRTTGSGTNRFLAVVLALLGGAVPVHAVEDPDSPTALPSDAGTLRSRVLEFLATGDTLEAMDILDQTPRAPVESAWVDSLMDRLVLPSTDTVTIPKPAAPPRWGSREGFWIARLDVGSVPVDRHHALWTNSARIDRVQRFDLPGTPGAIRAGTRLHGILGEFVDVVAVEPVVEWAFQRGASDAVLKTWALWTNELGKDLGGEAQIRFPGGRGWWYGPMVEGSFEGELGAWIAGGLEQALDSWNLSGRIRGGWIRSTPPATWNAVYLEVDSIPLTATGIVLPTTRGGSQLVVPISATIRDLGTSLERIDRNHWSFESEALALWRRGNLAIGPGLELEGRLAMFRERWLPDFRSQWPEGTAFLHASGPKEATVAVAGPQATAAPDLQSTRSLSIHANPLLSGTWKGGGNSWTQTALLAWNQPLAVAKGHPLADERRGLEARWASSFRW